MAEDTDEQHCLIQAVGVKRGRGPAAKQLAKSLEIRKELASLHVTYEVGRLWPKQDTRCGLLCLHRMVASPRVPVQVQPSRDDVCPSANVQ